MDISVKTAKTTVNLPYEPATPVQKSQIYIWVSDWKSHIYSSTIYNAEQMETTQMSV